MWKCVVQSLGRFPNTLLRIETSIDQIPRVTKRKEKNDMKKKTERLYYLDEYGCS